MLLIKQKAHASPWGKRRPSFKESPTVDLLLVYTLYHGVFGGRVDIGRKTIVAHSFGERSMTYDARMFMYCHIHVGESVSQSRIHMTDALLGS